MIKTIILGGLGDAIRWVITRGFGIGSESVSSGPGDASSVISAYSASTAVTVAGASTAITVMGATTTVQPS